MSDGSKLLGTLGSVFLLIYILFGIEDPIEIVTVFSGSIAMTAKAVGFMRDTWGVFAGGGVLNLLVWIFSGFEITAESTPIAQLWGVVVDFFDTTFFKNVPWG